MQSRAVQVVSAPTLSAPGEWDRYYQVNTALDPILGTPGVAAPALGSHLAAAEGDFVQASKQGFFLAAATAPRVDAVELTGELTGTAQASRESGAAVRRRRVRRTATGTHLQMETLVRGARLVGGDMRIHEDDGKIFAVTGRPLGGVGDRDPGEPPEVDEATALDTIAERFELESGGGDAAVEMVVFPTEEGAVWAYEVAFLVREHAADVRAFLRVEDYTLLLSYNVASAATGKAVVYTMNPLQTPQLVQVELSDLAVPVMYLRGGTIDVLQGAGTRIERSSGDFTAAPTEPAFDEGQVYFHLERIRAYFEPLVDPALMRQAPFTPMTVTVNDAASADNAYYSPRSGELSFGIFAGDRSSARSAAIVYHEFGHAITDAICTLGRSPVRNSQARGLSEGFSDYFAAAALEDPRSGVYVSGNPGGARNCADPGLRFPSDKEGEEHATGAVWAGVLWELRQSIDSEQADRIAIGSVDFLDPTSTFDEALTALRIADERLYGGSHAEEIDAAYAARGG